MLSGRLPHSARVRGWKGTEHALMVRTQMVRDEKVRSEMVRGGMVAVVRTLLVVVAGVGRR